MNWRDKISQQAVAAATLLLFSLYFSGQAWADNVPNAFAFADKTGVPLSQSTTSTPVRITGTTADAAISVGGDAGAQYCQSSGNNCSCDIAGWTAIAGTVARTDTNIRYVCARVTSSAVNSTATVATVTIQGIADTFSVTTLAAGADVTPDSYSFTDQTGVPLSRTITSAPLRITGLGAMASWTATNGTACVGSNTTDCGCAAGEFAASGFISNGEYICARHTSAAANSSPVNTTITMGSVSDTFSSSTAAASAITTPGSFNFTDQSAVALSTVVTSAPVQITGINAQATWTATTEGGGGNPLACVGTNTTNCGCDDDVFAATGVIASGQYLCARNTSSGSNATTVGTRVTVGDNGGAPGMPDIFNVTTLTGTADTTPDAFTFNDPVDVALTTAITSNPTLITGIDSMTTWTVTDAAGSHSACVGTNTVNCGCASGSFTQTGTITANQYLCVRHTSSGANSTAMNTLVTVGATSDTFTTTTHAVGADIEPDQFTFTDQSSVALNTVVTSAPVLISGINAMVGWSVTEVGGSACVGTSATNCGCADSAFATSGTLTSNQYICARHTTSGSYSTATNTTVSISSGASVKWDVFSSTTLAYVAPDTTPDAFTFTDQTGVPLSATVESNAITVSGINAAASISVSGGEYSVSGGTYTSAAGSVTNGQTVKVRHTSSASNSTTVDTTLSIGGVSDTFSSTTLAAGADNTPDAFTFTDQTGVSASTTVTSAPVLITGMTAQAAWTASGGTACVGTNTTNCGCADGSFAASGTITNNQYICARHTSSASYETATNTVVSVGGVSDTFTSTTATANDTTPAAFTFTDQTGVAKSSTITSAAVQITGITAAANWTATGGTACVGTNAANCGCADGSFAASGTVTNNQYICARHTSSASDSTAVNTTVTVGGVSDVFTSTTTGSGYVLSVTKTGTGKGLIKSGDNNIVCGPACTANYTAAGTIGLAVLTESGSTFTGWTAGPCNGQTTSPCNVTLSAGTNTVTANFITSTDPGTGAWVMGYANGVTGVVTAPSKTVNVTYTTRSCSELHVIVSSATSNALMSAGVYYVNSSGALVPLPASFTSVTPFITSPGNTTGTLFSSTTTPTGTYDLYFICDTYLNGYLNLDGTGLTGTHSYLQVTVP